MWVVGCGCGQGRLSYRLCNQVTSCTLQAMHTASTGKFAIAPLCSRLTAASRCAADHAHLPCPPALPSGATPRRQHTTLGGRLTTWALSTLQSPTTNGCWRPAPRLAPRPRVRMVGQFGGWGLVGWVLTRSCCCRHRTIPTLAAGITDTPRCHAACTPTQTAGPTYNLQREAAFNLSLIYRQSGADALARQLLRQHLTI